MLCYLGHTQMEFISSFCRVISIQSLKYFLGYCYVSGIVLAVSCSGTFSQQELENRSCTNKADIVKLIELGKDPKSFLQVSEQLKKCNQFAVPVLIEYVGIQYDEETRINAIFLIGEFGDRAGSTIVALTALSKDPNKNIRVAAISSLGAIGQSATITLKDILHNGDADSRILAAFALGHNGYFEDSMIPFLTKSLLDQEYSVEMRLGIVSVLRQIERKEIIPVLITALKDSNEYVRSDAASALGSIKAEEAVPALITALKDSDENVRSVAASALGSIKAEKAVPALITALKKGLVNDCTVINALQRISLDKFDIKDYEFKSAHCNAMSLRDLGTLRTSKLHSSAILSLRENQPKACKNSFLRWLIAWKCF
jgi:hypothetical protein